VTGIFALALAAVGPILGGATTIIDQTSDPTFARQVMRSYASCAVDSEHQLARKFVLMNPNEHLPDKEFQRVFPWQCLSPVLSAQIKMRPFQFRAAMAEVLIRLESRDRQKFNPATVPPLDWYAPKLRTVDPDTGLPFTAEKTEEEKAGFDGAIQDNLDGQIGECFVRANPAGALKVIEAWTDRAELSATKRIQPEITACTQKHEGLMLSRYRLHDAIAFSYYRLATAADVSK
jgi:hypothetical protein